MSRQTITFPEDQSATFVELFFDLVFVFSVTQVVGLLHGEIHWRSAGQGVLVFWAGLVGVDPVHLGAECRRYHSSIRRARDAGRHRGRLLHGRRAPGRLRGQGARLRHPLRGSSLDRAGALCPGGGQAEGWNLHPEHFGERHGLFVGTALIGLVLIAAVEQRTAALPPV